MPSRVAIVKGYGFHLIPDKADSPPPPFPSWEKGSNEFVLLSYGKDGRLLLSDRKEGHLLPKMPGWSYFQPFVNMSAWTATVDGWKWTLLHQYDDGLSVFAGIVI